MNNLCLREVRTRIVHDGEPCMLIVEYGLEWLRGYPKPIFFLRGSIETKGSRKRLAYGQIQDVVLQNFPFLNGIALLNSSDCDGLPFCAIERGWAYLGRTPYVLYDRKILAAHYRISEEEADWLQERVKTKSDLENFVIENTDRWRREATRVINELGLTVPTVAG
jgi:hypothetical protein